MEQVKINSDGSMVIYKPKRVIHKITEEHIKCILLSRLGFSYKRIQSQTGYSNAQIYKIAKENGCLVRAYRNGDTGISQRILNACDKPSHVLVKTIKQQLLLGGKSNSQEKEVISSAGYKSTTKRMMMCE